MVKESRTLSQRQSGNLDLNRRLRLHRRAQPIIAWLQREEGIVSLLPLTMVLVVSSAARHSISLWPVLLIIWALFVVFTTALWLIWWRNVMMLALYDDTAVVAPLLDFAHATFLRRRRMSRKRTIDSEEIVLPHLPILLARMPAGDGPALTPSQKAALKQLVGSTRYAERLYAPGLRAKIDEIVWG